MSSGSGIQHPAGDRFIAAAPSSINIVNRVLKRGNTFAVFDDHGDIDSLGDHKRGIYHNDCRFLSFEAIAINGVRPVLLNSRVRQDNNMLIIDLTNPPLELADCTRVPPGSVHFFRSKIMRDGACHEQLRMRNYLKRPLNLTLTLYYDADFIDIFEARGASRKARGTVSTTLGNEQVRWEYLGLDQKLRTTVISCTPRPASLTRNSCRFDLCLEPRLEQTLYCRFLFSEDSEPPSDLRIDTHDKALAHIGKRWQQDSRNRCKVSSSNEQFNDWINRSFADLQMLISTTKYGAVPYAGVPWFNTVFGRDSLITAYFYLWVDASIARGVLSFLADHQGTHKDPEREEEPGKILHETRAGEMAILGEVPFARYYGSVDATPLFLLLAAEYFFRTGDRDFITELWPNILQALRWVDEYADVDGDGFYEYEKHNPRGLVHQCWKDSDDSIYHADGSEASGAIAVCEVQGYVYAAKRQLSRLADNIGEHELAVKLAAEATALADRFHRHFWLDDLCTYALALDGNKEPCRVSSSNAGHCLFAGIAPAEYAQRTAATLMSPKSFSGWGIRTIAEDEVNYNPMSYHNGSVWPHDTAMIALGLARYGQKIAVMEVATGIFNAALQMDSNRLPELFCGFRRRGGEPPTLYADACAPQAWAAASAFAIIQACLGLTIDTQSYKLEFDQPQLPDFLDWLKIENLTVGEGSIDFIVRRNVDEVSISTLRNTRKINISIAIE